MKKSNTSKKNERMNKIKRTVRLEDEQINVLIDCINTKMNELVIVKKYLKDNEVEKYMLWEFKRELQKIKSILTVAKENEDSEIDYKELYQELDEYVKNTYHDY